MSLIKHRNNLISALKRFIKTVSGVPPITLLNCIGSKSLVNYKIYGNSVQNGTPTPDSPVEVESVGELVTDETDANYGKYKIPVKCSNDKQEIITNIYLDEPLRKIGNYADYIDFKDKIIIRSIGQKTFVGNEGLDSTLMTNALVYPLNNKIGGNAFCSHFVNKYPLPIATERYWGYIGISSLSQSGIGFFAVDSPYSEEEFKQYLSEQKLNGTPVEVYYTYESKLVEPIELFSLPTFKGTTIYSVDTSIQASNMEVTYYTTNK